MVRWGVFLLRGFFRAVFFTFSAFSYAALVQLFFIGALVCLTGFGRPHRVDPHRLTPHPGPLPQGEREKERGEGIAPLAASPLAASPLTKEGVRLGRIGIYFLTIGG